jgi:hypothetical protein
VPKQKRPATCRCLERYAWRGEGEGSSIQKMTETAWTVKADRVLHAAHCPEFYGVVTPRADGAVRLHTHVIRRAREVRDAPDIEKVQSKQICLGI